jgi:hypothetical protein
MNMQVTFLSAYCHVLAGRTVQMRNTCRLEEYWMRVYELFPFILCSMKPSSKSEQTPQTGNGGACGPAPYLPWIKDEGHKRARKLDSLQLYKLDAIHNEACQRCEMLQVLKASCEQRCLYIRHTFDL